MTREQFLTAAYTEAKFAGHCWPEYAACEAAEESAFGESQLAIQAKNLFGLKQGRFTRDLPTIEMPTHEWEHGEMVSTVALWPKFESWKQAFEVRMQVLHGLAPEFPHYRAALAASTGEAYITQVSQTWSTDPRRGANVLSIYHDYAVLFPPPSLLVTP